MAKALGVQQTFPEYHEHVLCRRTIAEGNTTKSKLANSHSPLENKATWQQEDRSY
jgi:hypothetical protein